MPGQSSTADVMGFLTLQELASRAVCIENPTPSGCRRGSVFDEASGSDTQQRIIPSMNFTCNGFVTEWTIGAESSNGALFPELQIWRQNSPSGGGVYTLRSSTVLNSDHCQNGLSEISENVFSCTLLSPVQFHESDTLGIFQPRKSKSQYLVLYESPGPLNYVREPGSNDIFSTTGRTSELQPLVAVEVETRTYTCKSNLYLINVNL